MPLPKVAPLDMYTSVLSVMIWEKWVTRFEHHYFVRLQSPIGGRMGQLSPIIQPLLPYVKRGSYGQTLQLIVLSLLGAVIRLLRYVSCTSLSRSRGHVSIPVVSYAFAYGWYLLHVLKSCWFVSLFLTVSVGTLCSPDMFAAFFCCRCHTSVTFLEPA